MTDTPKQEAMRASAALLKAGGTGSLSVIDVTDGAPFVTLVNIAADTELRPLLLISNLSHHTKCLNATPRASVMLHAPIAAEGDPMLTLRVTVSGSFIQIEDAEAKAAFLASHPYADFYAGFGDFNIWRMDAGHAHIIAGFGRAYSVRFKDLAALNI
jgi:heme iron utilization protein